jgi:hypothetical protein
MHRCLQGIQNRRALSAKRFKAFIEDALTPSAASRTPERLQRRYSELSPRMHRCLQGIENIRALSAKRFKAFTEDTEAPSEADREHQNAFSEDNQSFHRGRIDAFRGE